MGVGHAEDAFLMTRQERIDNYTFIYVDPDPNAPPPQPLPRPPVLPLVLGVDIAPVLEQQLDDPHPVVTCSQVERSGLGGGGRRRRGRN